MWQDYLEACFPYAMWVLLPLIPSILLFKIFPNNVVVVKGPLQGLTVKAGGAFAAYLLLFLLLSYPVNTYTPGTLLDQKHRFWEIDGVVGIIDEQGQRVLSGDRLRALLRDVKFDLDPDAITINGTWLDLRVVETSGKLPNVTLKIPNFGVGDLKFERSGDATRSIHLREPIFIKYDKAPNAALPVQNRLDPAK